MSISYSLETMSISPIIWLIFSYFTRLLSENVPFIIFCSMICCFSLLFWPKIYFHIDFLRIDWCLLCLWFNMFYTAPWIITSGIIISVETDKSHLIIIFQHLCETSYPQKKTIIYLDAISMLWYFENSYPICTELAHI